MAATGLDSGLGGDHQVEGEGLRIQALGFWGFEFKVWGSGFKSWVKLRLGRWKGGRICSRVALARRT